MERADGRELRNPAWSGNRTMGKNGVPEQKSIAILPRCAAMQQVKRCKGCSQSAGPLTQSTISKGLEDNSWNARDN
jgi:hypothetical protein